MNKLENLLRLDSNLIALNSVVQLNPKTNAQGIIINISEKKVRVIRRPPYKPRDRREVYLEIYRIISSKEGKTSLDLENARRIPNTYEEYCYYSRLLLDLQETPNKVWEIKKDKIKK